MELKLLSCPLCLKPHFQGVDSLRSSLISVATSHLTCPVCNESLLGLDKLTIHLFTHIDDNKSTSSPEATKKQEETVVNTSEEEINNSINSLTESLVEEEEGQIKCDICNFSFTDKNLLDMHQNLLHQTIPDKDTGLYSYHCHLCSKKFKKRGSLMVHLRVAHYGFSHSNPDFLDNHYSKNCTNDNLVATVPKETNMDVISTASQAVKISDTNKQWECDVCWKLFTTKYFLKKHKRLHTGEMPYFCAPCNKSFTFQQSYHKHMLYHSSEKPYVCNECGRAFKELSTLQNHARIHSGERPFGCETCGKRFRQRVSYLVHQRIHTGVMPYKCTACDKSFRYKVSQRSHKCPINPPGSVVRILEPPERIQKQETLAATASSAAIIKETKLLTRLKKQEPTSNGINLSDGTIGVKCIMSVDYNTGNINFIQNDVNDEIKVLYVDRNATLIDTVVQTQLHGTNKDTDLSDVAKNNEVITTALCQNTNQTSPSMYSQEQPDLFSMVMSPLLPEVESLCLTNSPVERPQDAATKKPGENLQVVNEDPLKDIFFDCTNK